MHFHILWRVPFFCVSLLFPGWAQAAETCDSSIHNSSETNAKRQACLIECQTYYQENPEARPQTPGGTCETSLELVRRNLIPSPSERLGKITSCGKGAYEGILTFPQNVQLYILAAKELGTSIGEHLRNKTDQLEKCEKDRSCKRELARGIFPSTTSDAELDQIIQHRSVIDLILDSEKNADALKKFCLEERSRISRRAVKDQGSWDFARKHELWENLKKSNAKCPSLLHFPEPKETSESDQAIAPSWLEKLGVKLRCHTPEKIAELSCYEVAKFIADPFTLAPGAGLAAKAMISAGLRSVESQVTIKATSQVGTKLLASGEAISATRRATLNSNESETGSIGLRSTFDGPDRPIPNRIVSQRTPSTNRADFILKNELKDMTTESQNRDWMKLAEKTKPDGKTVFLDIENSVMKHLNDFLKDKSFVTALTNRHKQIVMDKISSLSNEYSQMKVHVYSDFKSLRYAFEEPMPAEFKSRLSKVFREANQEFSTEMSRNGLVRAEDAAQNWMRGGFGGTADQATLASRYARKTSGENVLQDYTNSELQGNMSQTLQAVEHSRGQVQAELRNANLLENIPGSQDRMIPKLDVIEVARKEKTPEALQAAIETKYQKKISAEQAQHLLNYLGYVDEFSPGIHIAKREVATLGEATKGGLSADFAGMGAHNQAKTAQALAGARSLEEALAAARQGEKSVTDFFHQRMANRQNIIRNYLEEQQGMKGLSVVCSGDDCIAAVPKAMTPRQREVLVNRLSRTDDPAGMRMAFVPSQVQDATQRNLLAVHGESIEKATRRELNYSPSVSQALKAKLKNVLMAVEMNGSSAGQGSVRLITGNVRTPLNGEELAQIQKAFDRAVKNINQDINKTSELRGTYEATHAP